MNEKKVVVFIVEGPSDGNVLRVCHIYDFSITDVTDPCDLLISQFSVIFLPTIQSIR